MMMTISKFLRKLLSDFLRLGKGIANKKINHGCMLEDEPEKWEDFDEREKNWR